MSAAWTPLAGSWARTVRMKGSGPQRYAWVPGRTGTPPRSTGPVRSVDLVPGGRDLRGDRVAQHLRDGGEELGVLVGDAGEHHVGAGARVLDRLGREGGDGPGEGLTLGAGRLIAAVEEIAQQLGADRTGQPVSGRPLLMPISRGPVGEVTSSATVTGSSEA